MNPDDCSKCLTFCHILTERKRLRKAVRFYEYTATMLQPLVKWRFVRRLSDVLDLKTRITMAGLDQIQKALRTLSPEAYCIVARQELLANLGKDSNIAGRRI
jgi:hypothetical protein